MLTIVEVIKLFYKYFYGIKFVVKTDHLRIASIQILEGQMARWIERLQTYDFEAYHRKGIQHNNADELSRKSC